MALAPRSPLRRVWSAAVKGTFYMTTLSLAGAFLIGASAYLQPKATERNDAAGKGVAADLEVSGPQLHLT